MDWTTTSTLLTRLNDFDDHAAWTRFAERFRQPLVRFACSLGMGNSDAEDVAQESLLAFAQAYRDGQYDPSKGRLSRWLFGIGYRKALDARRERARREAKVGVGIGASSFWEDVPDEQTAGSLWDTMWEQSLVAQCLEQVRREVEPLTFRAFELAGLEQRAAPDVAAELGVSVKLVYNAKHRVLRRIRELREELDHVGG